VVRDYITVACNLAGQPQTISLRTGEQQILLTSDRGVVVTDGKVLMAADSVAIFKQS
jgi:hypothetical protein